FLSDSPKEFGEPVLETTFAKVRKPQTAKLEQPVEGRYVLVRVLNEINGQPWASASDIGVIQAK
ncbi:MAG: hypothetical protein HN727_14405, partial [Opitutae bacterium]|nr:hypothetical protein [Opitutae bacterium]